MVCYRLSLLVRGNAVLVIVTNCCPYIWDDNNARQSLSWHGVFDNNAKHSLSCNIAR